VEVDTAASIACGWAMTTMTSLRINDHISKNGRSLYSEVAVPNSRSKFFAQVVQVRPPLLRARAPKRASGSSAPATDANTGMKSRRARRESHPSRVRAKRAQTKASGSSAPTTTDANTGRRSGRAAPTTSFSCAPSLARRTHQRPMTTRPGRAGERANNLLLFRLFRSLRSRGAPSTWRTIDLLLFGLTSLPPPPPPLLPLPPLSSPRATLTLASSRTSSCGGRVRTGRSRFSSLP
jgi:hypothetical protein